MFIEEYTIIYNSQSTLWSSVCGNQCKINETKKVSCKSNKLRMRLDKLRYVHNAYIILLSFHAYGGGVAKEMSEIR